jgi:adenylate cyclase
LRRVETVVAPPGPADRRRHGEQIYRWTRWSLVVGMVAANVIGALVVFVLAAFIVPQPPLRDGSGAVLENLVITAGYVTVAVAAGIAFGLRRFASLTDWLPSGADPTPAQQLTVLRGPRRLAGAMVGLWGCAVVLFGIVDAARSAELGVVVVFVVAFGGLATCAVAYLLAERLLRPAAAMALAASEQPQRIVQSVAARAVLTWVLATGAPVLGIVAIGVASLAGVPAMGEHLGRTMVALGGTGLAVGLLATVFAAKASADPIASVREAIDTLAAGGRDGEGGVDDGPDLGLLQAGFNRMAAGLRERERLRDIFGRHVGEEVARQALEHGIELGGEARAVTVLFVDLVGSTALAGELPPAEVVAVLNRFFGIVVGVVEAHRGTINKFAGDAALAVFGAPAPLAERDALALRAARSIAERVRAELPERDFGVGVAAGAAVAGNIGTARRLEYTVIGDPVNEASRLTDLAKTLPGRVAASGVAIAGAGAEARSWRHQNSVVLRGRTPRTEVYVPSP